MHMVNKMTKTEKFNIVLSYNRLFHKVVHIFKHKVKKDLNGKPKQHLTMKRLKTSH